MSAKTAIEQTKGIYFIALEHRIFEEEQYVFATVSCNGVGLGGEKTRHGSELFMELRQNPRKYLG